MEARDLEYFIVVAELRSLRRAAEALNLSQPALSKSLRRLEQSAATKLVKRTPQGIELTGAGVTLLSHARRLRLSFDEILRELREFAQGAAGHVRVGSASVQIRTLLSPACIQLHEEFPKVTMRVTIGTNDELLPAVRRGELDVAIGGIGAHPRRDLVQERLYEERCVVYAAPKHPLAAKKKLTIRDLAGAKWALTSPDTVSRRMLQLALESAGVGPLNVVMESMALPPKLNLIAATHVLGFSPWPDAQEAAMQRGLVEIPIPGLRVTRLVGVSYRRDAYLPPAARRFVDIVKRKARELARLKGLA